MKTLFLKVVFVTTSLFLFVSCNKDSIAEDATAPDKTSKKNNPFLKELYYPVGISGNRSTFNSNSNASYYSRNEFNSVDIRMFGNYYGQGASSTNWGKLQYYGMDEFWQFAYDNGMRFHGHVLVYHIGLDSGQEQYIRNFNNSNQDFENNIKNHIEQILVHYKDKGINNRSYDVINEVINNGSGTYDNTIFKQRYGSDEEFYQFIRKCFTWAKDADPDAKLFYNDYGTDKIGGKRDKVLNLVNRLAGETANNGRRIIDGVGLQTHVGIDSFNYDAYAADVKAFSGTGLLIHISELDVSVNEYDKPWDANPFTSERQQKQAQVYRWIPEIYYNNTQESQRFGITLWDYSDKDSWLNNTNFRPKSGWEKPCAFWDDGFKKPAFWGLYSGIAGRTVTED